MTGLILAIAFALWVLRHERRHPSGALDLSTVGIFTAIMAALSAVGSAIGSAAGAVGGAVSSAAGALGSAAAPALTAAEAAAPGAMSTVGGGLASAAPAATAAPSLASAATPALSAAEMAAPGAMSTVGGGTATAAPTAGSSTLANPSLSQPSFFTKAMDLYNSPTGKLVRTAAGNMMQGGGGDKHGAAGMPPAPGAQLAHPPFVLNLPQAPRSNVSSLAEVLAQRRARLAALGLGG